MIGESGTGKSGQKYNYYACATRKKTHACNKKPVQKVPIEEKVLSEITHILYDDKTLEFIADCVWEYYQKECVQGDDALKQNLQTKLKEVETATANIMKAIEAGIFNDSTKQRMDELDMQRAEIKSELASLELTQALKITREYVLFFLTDLRNGDVKSPAFQKRLIDIFVNAIFVYDDRLTMTFNFSSDARIITLSDLDSINTEGLVFGRCAEWSAIQSGSNTAFEPLLIF